jgi:16S rRNA (cytosine1407-C5)-methyltransferase
MPDTLIDATPASGRGERRPSSGPRSFRLVCRDFEIPLVEDLLAAQGFRFDPEPFSPLCRRLAAEPFPLGASLAAAFGLIYIQDRSSMLPPLCLAPPPGAVVLDMCASPGGKTGFAAQLVGPSGFVLGNEPTPDRLTTLRRNLARLNLCRTATCCEADLAPHLPPGSFTHIQLDPPCSGWGTAAKNPKVLTLWREDKVEPLVALQRRLLATAATLLAPGGRLLYSTCTTNPAENEEQVRFALDALPLVLCPLTPLPGTDAAETTLPGVIRVDTVRHGGQGFFLACLTLPPSAGQAGAVLSPELATDLQAPPREKGRGGRDRTSPRSSRGREHSPLAPQPLEPGVFPGMESLFFEALGPGRPCRFGERVYFIPNYAENVARQGLRYKGFPLGAIKGGGFRPTARCRLLLGPAGRGDAPGLVVESPQALMDLLAGRSLPAGDLPGLSGLYYKDLALGFVTRKGDRALWSDRA